MKLLLTLMYLLGQVLTGPDGLVSAAGQLTPALLVSSITGVPQLLQSSTLLADLLLQLLTQTHGRKVAVEKIPDLRDPGGAGEGEEEEQEKVVSSDSDLTSCDAPPELRPAAGRQGRVQPADPVCDPVAGLLQADLPLSPAPQLLLQLLHLSGRAEVKEKHQVRDGFT